MSKQVGPGFLGRLFGRCKLAFSIWIAVWIVVLQFAWLVDSVRLLDTSVSCDQNNFVLLLNFDSQFHGVVYSEMGYPNCVYVNGTMLPQRQYQLKIPLTGCDTRTNEDGNFENAIIVQDNPNFLQSSDKKYLLTCIPSSIPIGPQRESLITVDFGGVTIDNSHTTTEIISNTLPAGSANAALKYNSYVVRLTKPVADSQIGRCWASDASSNLELSDEKGCSVQPRGNIWGTFERFETQTEVVFINKIKAWAFPTSNEVNIFCNLRICMSKACAFSNCTNEPKRSKRHESIGDLSEVETVTTKLRFRRQTKLPSLSATDLLTNPTEETYQLVCLTTSHLALIASCLFVFLLFIVLAVFLIAPQKICRMKR
ncbi:Zona pellucida domain-containing protein [Aphelenchoides bicaudatus]|nr:Zona pellucida domain-containing protein [Aphelenchoides bicaudatus]